MNILLTCAGRRNYLADFFRHDVPSTTRVIGVEADISAPALQVCDEAYQVPSVFASNYVDEILAVCNAEAVDVVISLNDLELPILAAQHDRFRDAGVLLLVSSLEIIDLCFDKLKTARWLRQLGLSTPVTFASAAQAIAALDAGDVQFPLIVKPRNGSASICVNRVYSREELMYAVHLVNAQLIRRDEVVGMQTSVDADCNVVIQEMVSGREYGVDVLNDLNGNVCSVYVKEKLAMRAGETDKACLRQSLVLEEAGQLIGSKLAHIGNLDCDVFLVDEKPCVLELNPRFGGGYPFSHLGGANYPAAILDWVVGREHDCGKFPKRYDVVFAKADGLVEIRRDVAPLVAGSLAVAQPG